MIQANKFTLLLLLVATIRISAVAFSASANDQKSILKEQRTIDGCQYSLVQSGSMNAKMLLVTIKICELGHYAQTDVIARGVTKEDLLTNDDIPKLLEMRFLKKMKLANMQRLFEAIFDTAAERNGNEVADEDIKNFTGLLCAVEKGTSILFVRNPDGVVRLVYDGETAGSVSSVDLCTALWSVLIQ